MWRLFKSDTHTDRQTGLKHQVEWQLRRDSKEKMKSIMLSIYFLKKIQFKNILHHVQASPHFLLLLCACYFLSVICLYFYLYLGLCCFSCANLFHSVTPQYSLSSSLPLFTSIFDTSPVCISLMPSTFFPFFPPFCPFLLTIFSFTFHHFRPLR